MSRDKFAKRQQSLLFLFAQEIPAVHRVPAKMPSKLNPPRYQFHHHKCMDRELSAPLDQLSHPTPEMMIQNNVLS